MDTVWTMGREMNWLGNKLDQKFKVADLVSGVVGRISCHKSA